MQRPAFAILEPVLQPCSPRERRLVGQPGQIWALDDQCFRSFHKAFVLNAELSRIPYIRWFTLRVRR